MDRQEMMEEMYISGCIQLFHPLYKHHFYVVEQKINQKQFIPLDKGCHVFFICPENDKAVHREYHDFDSVFSFIHHLILQDGWKQDMTIDIPKKNFVKWQICSQIK